MDVLNLETRDSGFWYLIVNLMFVLSIMGLGARNGFEAMMPVYCDVVLPQRSLCRGDIGRLDFQLARCI